MIRSLQVFLFSILLLMSAGIVIGQTPIANYPFDGTAKDLSINKNNASVHAAKLTQDRFGIANRAFLFDGIQDFIQAPNESALNTDLATISFWTKATALPASGEAYLISFGGWQERYKISVPTHGKLVFTTNNTSGISDMDSGDGNVMVPGEWQHWVFVHDGAKDIIYLNGMQVAEKAVSGNLNGTTYPLGIGYNPVEKGNYFDGVIDQVEIYGEALSAAQVATLHLAQKTAPVINDGLVADYTMKNNGEDASQFGNHAELQNVNFVTDRFGFGNTSAHFNGNSSEMTASNSSVLNSDYTTVAFWVKPNSLPASGESFLISYGGWQERYKISVPSHGKVVFTTNGTGGISDMDAGGGNELTIGEWTYVVAVHDGTNDKIYINGILANSKAVAGALNHTTKPLGIGYNAVDGGNWFDGAIDEVRIYNYALNDAQILSEYTLANSFPGTNSTLVASYPFSGNLRDISQFQNEVAGSATYTQDRFTWANNAAYFNGTDSLTADNSIALNTPKATISMWVKADELPASGEAFLLSNGGWQERYKISLPSHGKVVFTTNATSGISDMDAGGGHELVPGAWTHLAFVHDGTNDKIFVNGVLANSKNVTGDLNNTGKPLGIGWNPIDKGNYFKGAIDEVQIFNNALSDAEVLALYQDQNTEPVITSDIVADYPMTGNANDVSEYHNNAIAAGAQLTTDRHGLANHAYTFNGIDAKITAPNSPQQNTDFTTISFWINPKTLPASGESFILSNGGWQERWKISLPAHGKVVFTTNGTGGISDMDAGGGNELTPGVWTMVTMTHDGNNDKIYINGAKVAEKSVTGTLNNTVQPLGIGWNPIDNGNYFDGSLDQVLIYDRALNDAEIMTLYNEQNTPPVLADTEAPSAPLNLTAEVDHTTIHLMWLPASDNVGVAAYNVYQDSVKIATTSLTHFTVDGLNPLTWYNFGVSAVDTSGNESTITELNVRSGEDVTPDVTPPSAPGNLSGNAGAYSVLLTWEPSIDDREVKAYVISVDGTVFDTIPGTATSILVTGLDPETPYSFEVYAFDNAGNNSEVSELTLSTLKEVDTGEPGLVAWYPFDGDANDATPYKNNGTIGGNPQFDVPSHANGGSHYLKFDGDGDSVLINNAVQLISDYATVSFWVWVTNVNIADAESYILDFGHWDERWKISLPQHLKIVWTTNSKTVQFPSLISDMDSGDGNELVKGFWWYVTMVHDGSVDQIYVNGELANSKPAPGTLNTTDNKFCMGSNPVEGGQYFNGGLDEVKLYNKALTATEIQNLYKNGTSGNHSLDPTLAAYVKDVFPNPTSQKLYINHSLGNNQPLLLRIFDLNGRQVGAINYEKGGIPEKQLNLDVAKLIPGSYYINFVYGGKDLGSTGFIKH